MAATILLGDETTSGNSSSTVDLLWMSRWAAAASLDLNRIRCWGIATGNVKVGLYADSGGSPEGQALLTANNADNVIIASQWNQITVPAYGLTSSTYYWLVLLASAACVRINTISGSQTLRYVSQSYSGGIPSYCPLSTSSASWDLRVNGFNVEGAGSLAFGGGF